MGEPTHAVGLMGVFTDNNEKHTQNTMEYFQLEGTYNDCLVQLLDHFRAWQCDSCYTDSYHTRQTEFMCFIQELQGLRQQVHVMYALRHRLLHSPKT